MIFQVSCQQSIINTCYLFYKLTSPLFCFFQQICRNRNCFKGCDISFIGMINERLHVNQVYYSCKILFSANWYLNRNRISTKFFLNLLNDAKEIGAGTIHFIYKSNARHNIFIGLSPHCFRLRFNTSYSTKNSHRSIENPERAFYFNRKINVPWCINDINFKVVAFIFPICSCSGRSYCDPSFLFLNHPVHLGISVMYLTHTMCTTSIEQNTFCSSGLTGIYVGHDPDVSGIFQIFIHLSLIQLPLFIL